MTLSQRAPQLFHLPHRFWVKVKTPLRPGECWPWMSVHNGKGYGRFRWEGKKVSTHRLVYKILIGPIPEDLEVDHKCRNRLCVNPDHLDLLTHAENIRRIDRGSVSWNNPSARPKMAPVMSQFCRYGHPIADTCAMTDCRIRCRSCKNETETRRRRRLKSSHEGTSVGRSSSITNPITEG